jgi:hypothetical protein
LVAVKVYVVVVVGLTVAQELAATLLPTPPLMLMVVAPLTCQQSCELWPELMVCGLALNTTTCGIVAGATVTVMGAVTVAPLAPVAVRVKVVVVVNAPVETLPFNGTAPMPPLIDTEVALLVAQLKVDDPPGAMVIGLASNRTICGASTGVVETVTVTVAFTELPPAPVAVKV